MWGTLASVSHFMPGNLFSAYEILSDPVKRRAFNSIDPTFDNSVPSKSEAKENFFEVFSPVFERNAR